MTISLSRFLQSRTNIYVCRNLGWQYALAYIHFLGSLYFFLNRKECREIKNAVKTVFGHGKTWFEIRSITINVFNGIMSHYYEKLFNVYTRSSAIRSFFKSRIADSGLDVIRKGLSKGRGVLLITGHYGGVEFIPGYLGVNDIPVSIIVKFATEDLRKTSNRKANEFSIKTIDAGNSRNIIKEIFRDLKANRVVVIQCDEIDKWRPAHGDRVSFLGASTFLDRAMNVLIKRGGAETVFGLMHRVEDHRYRFIAVGEQELLTRTKTNGQESLGRAALKWLEKYIMDYPHEWYQWKKYFSIPSPARLEAMPVRTVPMLPVGSSAMNPILQL